LALFNHITRIASKARFTLILVGIGLFGLSGCEYPQTVSPSEPYTLDVPDHFPQPQVPEDNQLTKARVELGRQLFFEKALSRDSTVSCASCHTPSKSFTDGEEQAVGIEGRLHKRNTMALVNVAYAPRFNWDGQVNTLEKQAIIPITAHNEMDMDFETLAERLNADSDYRNKFQKAYPDTAIDTYSITRALASFQRTLISGNSPYDQFLQGDSSALSASARRGMTIFFSERAECFHCHTGTFFTDHSLHNNGLYEEYQDKGAFEGTGNNRDRGRFKVPTLRNVELTAPYMHDGSMNSLDEVIRHYESGGKDHPNRSPLIRPFTLTDKERRDLVNFLKSLTDRNFTEREAFNPPPQN
jgi:cytochrome c peroxidase